MDRYLRWFIKYQAYMIVVFTLLMVVLVTPAMAQNNIQEIENLRFGGTVATIFGFSWAAAVLCLVYSIQNEDKRFIYPYLAVFGLDLTLLLLREFYLMIAHGFFIEIITVKIFIATITIPYVFASLFALHRLFTVDPIETQRSEGFVRFDRNETTSGIQENPHSTISTSTPNGVQVV
ncbi:uncharacterized protein LOC126563200 [Anopheles maculipalpis]|uniref:uncharacterized protein LOC126563200 n=1 Tax=Anopheles maculipalpis TaxID=1496333 RepID=UPI002158C387|nr:uncharacterized protein LOC126563200 [Anopheles maculipalpis]